MWGVRGRGWGFLVCHFGGGFPPAVVVLEEQRRRDGALDLNVDRCSSDLEESDTIAVRALSVPRPRSSKWGSSSEWDPHGCRVSVKLLSGVAQSGKRENATYGLPAQPRWTAGNS